MSALGHRVSSRLTRRSYPDCRAIILHRITEQAAASAFEVAQAEVAADTRGTVHAALARQVAMYLAHVVGGLSLTQVGRMYGRDRTTVAHACAVVEDRRDDPRFDRAMTALEYAVRQLGGKLLPSDPR